MHQHEPDELSEAQDKSQGISKELLIGVLMFLLVFGPFAFVWLAFTISWWK